MKIGALRHIVSFLRPATTRDTYGEVNANDTYTPYATRHVAITPIDSREMLTGNKPDGITTHTITLRYMDNVQINDVILFGDRHLEISGINNLDERNLWMEITATELVRPIEITVEEP